MTKFQIVVITLLALIACAVIAAAGVALSIVMDNRPLLPTNTPGPTPTPVIHKWRGSGDDVLFFDVTKTGPGLMAASFAGDSNFAVTLYRGDGKYIDLLVNAIGKYDGKTSFVIKTPGQYYLKVEANGRDYEPNWAIQLAPPQ